MDKPAFGGKPLKLPGPPEGAPKGFPKIGNYWKMDQGSKSKTESLYAPRKNYTDEERSRTRAEWEPFITVLGDDRFGVKNADGTDDKEGYGVDKTKKSADGCEIEYRDGPEGYPCIKTPTYPGVKATSQKLFMVVVRPTKGCKGELVSTEKLLESSCAWTLNKAMPPGKCKTNAGSPAKGG